MSKESMLQGLGLVGNLIVLLIEAVGKAGGTVAAIHRLTKPEGKETLAKIAKIIAEDARASEDQPKERVPKDGDRAYSIYHGMRWEGRLTRVPWHWGGCWVIVPPDGKERFDHYEGGWKCLEKMETANLGVYADRKYMDVSENDNTLVPFGRGRPENKMVEFDNERGMWYCQAFED